MERGQHSTVLSLLLILLVTRKTVAYANWLPCYVEFDESEVIMNHRVVPAQKASPSLTIQVRPQGTDTWSSSSLVAEVTPGQIYEARLDWTGHRSANTGQYVLEIGQPGGSFAVDPTGHCEGHVRAWAQSAADVVLFQLDGSANVSITGAWAVGHSAVSLTPTLDLHVTTDEVDPDL